MKILQGYINRTLSHTIGLVILLFMGIDVFILLAGQLHDYSAGNYGVLQAFIFVALSLPVQLYHLFPMAAFIGVLLGMGLLDSHSEILVMRAAGVSSQQLLMMVLRTGFILMLIATLIGEFIGPLSQHLAQVRRLSETTSGNALKTGQGLWLRDGQDFIHIEKIYSDKHLASVTRYSFDNQQRLTSESYAQEAIYHHNLWHLLDVQQSFINNDGSVIKSQHQDEAVWHLALNPHLLQISQIEPDEMTLLQLDDYIKYRSANGLLVDTYQIAYWHRLLQPLSTLVMIFLAVPFIFGPLRSVTAGFRILTGVIVGFLYYTLDQMFAPMSEVLQFPPFVAVILPTVLFALIGFILLSRVR